MPLKEFVEHPVAQELLHNGQTFQVCTYKHHKQARQARARAGCGGCSAGACWQTNLSD